MFAGEELAMELLVNVGWIRPDTMETVHCARQKNRQSVTKSMVSSESAYLQTHEIQTALISWDEGRDKVEVNLIPIYVQDHLMNIMLYQDLARKIILLRKEPHA